jgi:serine/threonine protein phosphatase 1
MVTLASAHAPADRRIYALGDVHGRLDSLAEAGRRIVADLRARPMEDWRVIIVGDLVDRGPDSRGVIDWVIEHRARLRIEVVLGNHDEMLRGFLADPDSPDLYTWLDHGGLATLRSYGIAIGHDHLPCDPESRAALRARLFAAMPDSHRRLLAGLPRAIRAGDFLFVHAGIRPGVSLEAQAPEDLVWIREPFLSSTADHGVVVVHGHTPERRVAVRPNRIGIDQGAVFGGGLTCLVIDGGEVGLLGPQGVEPLAVAA